MRVAGALSRTSVLTDCRFLAVNAEREIFLADWDGDVHKLDANGTRLATADIPTSAGLNGNLCDIDVSPAGMVVPGNWSGQVIRRSDSMFSGFTALPVAGTEAVFVSVASEAVPVTLSGFEPDWVPGRISDLRFQI